MAPTPSAVRTDYWGRPMPAISADSAAATQHVMNLMQPSPLVPGQRFLRLDLSDPLQNKFFMDRFGGIPGSPLGPHFPTRAELAVHLAQPAVAQAPLARPMLHSLTAAPAAGTYVPVALIAAFNYNTAAPTNSAVTAEGIISVPGGFSLADVLMEVYDGPNASGPRIATASGTSYGQYATAANASGNLTKAGDQATALFSGHYTDASKTTVPFAVATTIGPQPPVTIAVTNPAHRITKQGSPITVAIGRQPGYDTDYYFNPGQPSGTAELLLSVGGNAASQSPSVTFVPGQTVGGSLVLLKQSGAQPGGGTVVYPKAVNTACTVAGTTLTWNFNGPPFNAADFGVAVPWSPGDVILMQLNLTATMNTPSGQTGVTIAVSSDQSGKSGQQIGNTYFIDAIQFYWGCVSARAKVRMADGTEKVIRDIGAGDWVASVGGAARRVVQNKYGTEVKPMLEIETADGDVVQVTDGHPVLTTAGPRIARLLQAGERVLTIRGEAAIARIRAVQTDGDIRSLVLAGDDGSEPNGAAFYADGILVGDDRMQAATERDANASAARAALDALLASAIRGWTPGSDAEDVAATVLPSSAAG